MGIPSVNQAPTQTQHPVLSLCRSELPLTVKFNDKTYVLVRTKSDKLLLQKPL